MCCCFFVVFFGGMGLGHITRTAATIVYGEKPFSNILQNNRNNELMVWYHHRLGLSQFHHMVTIFYTCHI